MTNTVELLILYTGSNKTCQNQTKREYKMKTSYTVIYRIGGTENCQWKRVLGNYADFKSAEITKQEIEKQGYKAIIEKARLIDNIGLPDSF